MRQNRDIPRNSGLHIFTLFAHELGQKIKNIGIIMVQVIIDCLKARQYCNKHWIFD